MALRTAILLVSEDAQLADQVIGPLLKSLRQVMPGVFLIHQLSVTSQRHWIEDTLCRWSDEEDLDLILTVGGTFPAPGLSGEEIVPEATASVVERLVPGLSETMRIHALDVNADAVLDRGITGIRGRTLIVNLPGEAALLTLFWEYGVGLLPRILSRLDPSAAFQDQPDAEDSAENGSSTPSAQSPTSPKLDEAEFAEFLRNRRSRPGT